MVAVLSAIFGVYWYLFAGYLLLNILDWGTGWYKANLSSLSPFSRGV